MENNKLFSNRGMIGTCYMVNNFELQKNRSCAKFKFHKNFRFFVIFVYSFNKFFIHI